MAPRTLHVVILGLGPIGRAVAREIANADDLTLVGAVDPAPTLAGTDVGDLTNDGRLSGVRIASSLAALGRRRADAAVHAAGSRFPAVYPQLVELVERRLPVASTCEEMIAAFVRWPAKARALDRKARAHGVAVLPAGINPGFVMDLLPEQLAAACVSVRSVRVERHVDTSKRRRALQLKTGAGLTRSAFRERAKRNAVGHVGLRDSLLYVVQRLGLDADVPEETLRPIVATRAVGTGRARVARGRVAGVHQRVAAKSRASGKTVAVYELKMAIDLRDPHDEIRLVGDPGFTARIDGGIHGDRGTVACVLSTLRRLAQARPGLCR